ncbi:restriction endonuclease subunit S [Comamonas sp. C24C]
MNQTKGATPSIRFRGYDEEWTEKSLSDLCAPLMYGLNAAATKYDGKNKYLRITDIDDEYRTFFHRNLTSPNTDLSAAQGYRLAQGDIVLARTGASVGKTYLYKEEDGRVFFAGFLIRARVYNGKSAEFIFQNTLTNRYEQFVKVTSQRSGQPGINAQEYGSYTFFVPPLLSETSRVGRYLTALDDLALQHQRKHDKLVTLKQAMLKKMFPQKGATTPEIRFSGFTDDWKSELIGNVTQPISNNTLSRAHLNYKSGFAKNVHYGDILVKFGEVLDAGNPDLPFISHVQSAGNFASSKLQDGDVIIADAAEDATVGKSSELVNVGDRVVLAGLHTIALRPSIRFASAFLGYFMNSNVFHDQLLPLMQGTKVLSISRSALKETLLVFPIDLAEQQKIGTYFRNLDKLITQHSTQLEKLKQIRSAFLEKMFV